MAIVEPVLFYADIDWEVPFSEEFSWSTSIFISRDESEQRRANRFVPNRRFTYRVKSLSAKRAGLVRALVYGGQDLRWLVPVWPGDRRALISVAADATTVTVISTNARFVVGQAMMLFDRPANVAVARVITDITGNVITFSGTPGRVFPRTRTHVVPLVIGTMAPSMEVTEHDAESNSIDVIFDVIVTEPTPFVLA